jgi:hypothetical protein
MVRLADVMYNRMTGVWVWSLQPRQYFGPNPGFAWMSDEIMSDVALDIFSANLFRQYGIVTDTKNIPKKGLEG